MPRPLLIALLACSGSQRPTNAPSSIAWEAPIEIAQGGGRRGDWHQNQSDYDYVDDPTVAYEASGAVAVAWVDQRRKDVLFQIYERDGSPRFPSAVEVSHTPAVFSWLPRIGFSLAHPRDVYVLWQEIVFSGGSHGGEAWFARSLDGGASFGEPIDLSRSLAGDGKGRISKTMWHNGSLDLAIASDGAIYATWTEYEGRLWFSRSEDRGASFSPAIRVAHERQPARGPALGAGPDGLVYLAWTVGEHDAADIRIATSTDGGRTFGAPAIASRTAGFSDAPKLAVGGDRTLHLAFAESEAGPFDRYHVRYTRSRDGGKTFEPDRVVTSGIAAYPSLALDEAGGVCILWELFASADERARGLGIVYSRDGGDTFSAPERVPASRDPAGGWNGSHQGRLMRKLAVGHGEIAVVNSALAYGVGSRVWLVRGRPLAR